MIELQDITFRYKDSEQENSLQNINLSIPTGEAVLLCGKSGCGKTTITRLLNGLVPHFYEGIVILDEATSSVDPENEHELLSAILELTQGKTLISIAHRLTTVQNADQILVIDNGTVVQQGTHSELLTQDGIYQSFWKQRKEATGWTLGGRS